ncbi:MAG TPA: hypothetical protein VFA39_19960 [Steroidobacteraceae bacterium]|nr:hypothetical protein [Steroidobacteraceae bacterium]
MSAVIGLHREQAHGRRLRAGELGTPRIPGQRCRLQIPGLVTEAAFVGRPGSQRVCWVVRLAS